MGPASAVQPFSLFFEVRLRGAVGDIIEQAA